MFTHASSVVTRALTTTAGSETHHQHQEAGAFTWRQHASLGGRSGGSAGSPHRRGASDALGRKTEVRGSSEICITAQTGGELGPEVEMKAGETLHVPCPAPCCPPSPSASADNCCPALRRAQRCPFTCLAFEELKKRAPKSSIKDRRTAEAGQGTVLVPAAPRAESAPSHSLLLFPSHPHSPR